MNILVTGARAPISVDIARALAGAGHRVWTADCQRFPIGAFSPATSGHIHLPSPREDFTTFQRHLADACCRFGIEYIIPTCEEVFWLAASVGLPKFTHRFCPSRHVLGQLHNKFQFSALAGALGYGAEKNILLTSQADVARFLAQESPAEFVLKPVYSRFASSVLVSPRPKAVSRLRPTPAAPWLAQTRVIGEEVCLYNIAKEGALLLHTAYRPRWRAGKGAGVYFEPVDSADLRELSRQFVTETHFTGQISFDVIESARGPVAIECNPRGTSGAHLAVQDPQAFAEALLGRALADFAPTHPVRLGVPLLMYNPWLVFTAAGRAARRTSIEAMRAAGIPRWAQVVAAGAVLTKGLLAGEGPTVASTNDIEWNGETIGIS